MALTIKESTVLLLGYSLGDVNVLTALDWSKNVFRGEQTNYPHEVIQVLRKENPNPAPYRTRTGIVIFETDDLTTFFKEFSELREKLLASQRIETEELKELAKLLQAAEDSEIDKFIDDHSFRDDVVEKLRSFPNLLITSFETFLDKCITRTWSRSADYGQFKGYAQNLTMLLDLFDSFTFEDIPPALFEILGSALNDVSGFVGKTPGKSYAADTVWHKRKGVLNEKIKKELSNFATQREYTRLTTLLES